MPTAGNISVITIPGFYVFHPVIQPFVMRFAAAQLRIFWLRISPMASSMPPSLATDPSLSARCFPVFFLPGKKRCFRMVSPLLVSTLLLFRQSRLSALYVLPVSPLLRAVFSVLSVTKKDFLWTFLKPDAIDPVAAQFLESRPFPGVVDNCRIAFRFFDIRVRKRLSNRDSSFGKFVFAADRSPDEPFRAQ